MCVSTHSDVAAANIEDLSNYLLSDKRDIKRDI